MANNYLEFSETLDNLSTEEESWLREQLEIVHVYGDREYAEGHEPDELNSAEHWWGCRAWRNLPEYDPEDGTPVGFEYEFIDGKDRDREGRYLWLSADECGFPDRAALLAQDFLRKFRPDQYWTLSYATTCSKPRAGEFGGGCVFVTASEINWCSTWDFLEAHAQTFCEKATVSEHPFRSYDLAIDGPVLRAQRERLLEFTDALHQGKQVKLCPADTELLEGLVDLTDEIADQAADRHGIECLLNVTEGAASSFSTSLGVPPTRNPANLTHEELVEIATGMVRILYGIEQPDGAWTYASDKPWCGSEVCEAAAALLDRFGLVPQMDGSGQPIEQPKV